MVFKLSIPDLKEPTAEELRALSLKWFESVGPTLIDQWPPDVAALSMPTTFIRFPNGLINDLFEHHGDVKPSIQRLAAELDDAMGWERHFIRLNSRSPKDAGWPFEVPATCSGKEAMTMIGSSERMLDDLCYFECIPEHPAFICLREFVYDMRSRGEYRCFVKDGDLIAVSHYDYSRPIQPPQDQGADLRARIDTWFKTVLRPRLHISTVVFDIFPKSDGSMLLIELNPYGLSDPCWFGTYPAMENSADPIAFSSQAA